ncbi:MAG: hypothetical protein A4S14_05270 [Proteobacteria bacterium SG_bin9]|nr:MAG: hypothetical protein A4S14_05270 [Proteobacteria bacterium SG_bin9]
MLKVLDGGKTLQVPNFLGGAWKAAEDDVVRRPNPANLEEIVSVSPNSSGAIARQAIDGVTASAGSWRKLTPTERGKIVLRAAAIAERDRDEIAALITREQGKPIRESYAEVKRAVDIMEYVSGFGRRLGGNTLPSEEDGVHCFTMRESIGTVALISPWNIPFAIPCWKIAPAFVCGSPIVFKPSPFTPAIAAKVVSIFLEAGVPQEAIALVHGGPEVGEELVRNPKVKGISFTGSTKVGTSIHVSAAPRLAKTQLEMGGKNPLIVLADADIPAAVKACMVAAFDVSGQRCTCTSRVLVQRNVKDRFTSEFVAAVKKLKVGDGADPATEMGPLIDTTRFDAVNGFVERARGEGGTLLAGGSRLDVGNGNFFAPTVIDSVSVKSEIAREEVFGPVVAIMPVDDLEQGLQIANDVEYGLAASIFTKDINRAFSFIDGIEAGMIHINRPNLGGYSHFPFGGQKNSSHGSREIGEDTLSFYTNIKSVYIRHD